MKHETEGVIVLELSELIKMNRMVRNSIDLVGFVSWYDAIPGDEQSALLCHLHLFAQQAGYNQQTWQRAVEDGGQAEDDPIVQTVVSFRGGYSIELGIEQDWLNRLRPTERRRLLPFFVYLFGYAEARVFTRETEESCSHWWHRDLLDERVVQALLADPEFWRTSMKDDRAIKRQA